MNRRTSRTFAPLFKRGQWRNQFHSAREEHWPTVLRGPQQNIRSE
jgi:hypothetical protein